MYCTADEVYAAAQIDNTVVAEAAVNNFIRASELEVDRITFTTYWVLEDSGTASDGSETTLEDTSKSWSSNEYSNYFVWIYSGTGSGQIRKISTNTTNTLTVESDFTTLPDATTKYRIVYCAQNPTSNNEFLDGTGTNTLFTTHIPIVDIESLDIYEDGSTATSISISNLYKYKREGRLVLSNSAESSVFYNVYPQSVDLKYAFGVYTIPEDVKRYTIISAAERMLSAQMGSTYNVPSTYSLPEGSVTIGQAYINIDSTAKRLYAEKQELAKSLVKYAVMA